MSHDLLEHRPPAHPRGGAPRARYSPELKAEFAAKYGLCEETCDKEELAETLGIGSLHKAYNLASRMGLTRNYGDWYGELDGEQIEIYDPKKDPARLQLRERPDEVEWTERDDDYLRRKFGKQFIEQIAFVRGHTETAIAYRARQLRLRKACRLWDRERVCRWLGISHHELDRFGREVGLKVLPCCDRSGVVRATYVDAVELARMLSRGGLFKRLIAERDADVFFIREVIESAVETTRGTLEWEANIWVSHGHTCLNPFSGLSFGLFFDGTDDKLIGARFEPRQLSPANVNDQI